MRIVLLVLVVFLAMAVAFVFVQPAFADSGNLAIISHICIEPGATVPEVLVVWPNAPTGLISSTGILTGTGPGGSFTIPLSWQGYFGGNAKWIAQGPTAPGVYTITSGIVGLGGSQQTGIKNVPFVFSPTKCTTTAVTLSSFSATKNNILNELWEWLSQLFHSAI